MPRTSEPHWSTSYETSPGERTVHSHQSKKTNDDFAKAMELMGVSDIVKSFYNPAMRQWFRYENDGPEVTDYELLHIVK